MVRCEVDKKNLQADFVGFQIEEELAELPIPQCIMQHVSGSFFIHHFSIE